MNDIVIVGAGLAGLSCGLLLNKHGFAVTIIEKQPHPGSKVCGEYISNEVLPYLDSLGIQVFDSDASRISRLELTTLSGRRFATALPLGGFGLSRLQFDGLLYRKARQNGINLLTGKKVNDVAFVQDKFEVTLADNSRLTSDLVIGAYGKRSNLDQKLKRSFFYHRSPYMGVKYHIQSALPRDLIQLHNFNGGYCGICKIEKDRYSLCYLTRNQHLKDYSSIQEMEHEVLFRNRLLKQQFSEAEFISEKPQVINEISFERKLLVDHHILFCGDAAAMISPLCGNGMAMAIHSGKLLAETVIAHCKGKSTMANRGLLESAYQYQWQKEFAFRIRAGRTIQSLFLKPYLTDIALATFRTFPGLTRQVIKRTHGKAF